MPVCTQERADAGEEKVKMEECGGGDTVMYRREKEGRRQREEKSEKQAEEEDPESQKDHGAERELVEGGDEATKAAEEAVSIYAEHCNTPTIVPNAPEITEYTDVDNEGVNLKRGPQMRDSQPQRLAGRGRRRHRLTYDASEEDASTQLFLGLEASLISSHRQQNKHMQLMNRNSQRIQQTFTQGFGNVET
ncbi:hypothetical protein NDU88_004039 [Pleurodeles waltl]|uniref:Uncharacterized protein n=1 Tax=Pleurodeles waltl TaxID=8319 RepID=A0AAV7VIT2_PLEWA|nr:hypothetical protein NDU88_004039 [Pleurodeles waltl]